MREYLIYGSIAAAAVLIILITVCIILRRHNRKMPSRLVTSLLPKEATLKTDNSTEIVDCRSLVHGDIILVAPGEIVPIDCILLEKTASFAKGSMFTTMDNTTLYEGDEVQGGLCLTGESPVHLKVAANYEDSFFVKCTNIYLESVKKVSFYGLPSRYIKRITNLFKNGILIVNPGCLKSLRRTKAALFDKQSILNPESYELKEIIPNPESGLSKKELLIYAAKAETPYCDSAIGRCLINASKDFYLLSEVTSTAHFSSLGIETTIDSDTIIVGSFALLQEKHIKKLPDFSPSETAPQPVNTITLHVALNDSYIGSLILSSDIREDVHDILTYYKRKHISTVLLAANDICCDTSQFNLSHCNFKSIIAAVPLDNVYTGILTLRKKIRKHRTRASLAYFDTTLTDSTICNMADIKILVGPVPIHKDITYADIVLLSNNCYSYFAQN
ncbi:MAG: hypothetical protein IJW18_07330 [Lachnospiraceae bacterium]|nr:hypothetical protein [Lachnospiraceae bacterium]